MLARIVPATVRAAAAAKRRPLRRRAEPAVLLLWLWVVLLFISISRFRGDPVVAFGVQETPPPGSDRNFREFPRFLPYTSTNRLK